MRRVMFKTNGTMTRHTMSFTKNAEKMPDVKITAGNNRAGLKRRSTTSAIHSKKPTRCRLPTISIIENSRTIVEKSMKCQSLCRRDNASCDHSNRTDDGGARAINFESWEFAQRKNEVTGKKDDVSGDDASVRKCSRRNLMHVLQQDSRTHTCLRILCAPASRSCPPCRSYGDFATLMMPICR